MMIGAQYGLNDAFSLYAVGGYSLEFPESTRLSPRHAGSFSAGVFYAFDYLSGDFTATRGKAAREAREGTAE